MKDIRIIKNKDNIINLFEQGKGIYEISRHLGFSNNRVSLKLKEWGYNTNKRKTGNKNKSWKGYGEISAHFWSRIRNGAKKRKLDFDISIEYGWNLFIKQNYRCNISHLKLNFPSDVRNTDGTASLDRIDSSKGYIKGNVQWLHKHVNIMKWDLEQKDFIKFCNIIHNFNQGDNMEPFLICIFIKPTVKESEDGTAEKLIVEPKAVMAKDIAHATAKAYKYLPEEYENVDRIEVRVLPFQRCCKS